MTLQQDAPLTATLHFLRDFLSYGTDHPNSSSFNDRSQDTPAPPNPPQIQRVVKQLVASQGEALTQRILTGMMFHFPKDCFPDASGVLRALFELMPEAVATWVKGTLEMLPAGTVRAGEGERLMNAIGQKIQAGEFRKVRVILQGKADGPRSRSEHLSTNYPLSDFTNSYRRRNVAPREGLGRLEATRFRFSG